MTELEKQVNNYYVKRYKEEAEKYKLLEKKFLILCERYEEKIKELERSELITELLIERLEKNK